jgi:hypothetical protein
MSQRAFQLFESEESDGVHHRQPGVRGQKSFMKRLPKAQPSLPPPLKKPHPTNREKKKKKKPRRATSPTVQTRKQAMMIHMMIYTSFFLQLEADLTSCQ